MAMKKNNRDYIAQMNKGMKQKLSMLLIACLLFTGYHGLTISGRAEQEEKEQTNEISVSGTQVKVQLLGEDIRRAAKEAIEKGDRVEAAALQGYSGDEDLQKEYAEIFSSEKEVYEIPLDSISEGLSESLAEEEAGLQVFVERDAKDLERLVRKESKESLLLYDKNSQLTQLFPKNNQEETKATVEKEQESGAEEALASDSNIEKTERNTELTGSELITFLYKNKADHRISFQLSVDGNTYPKVVVSPKTQLFKSFLDKLKKEEKKPKTETEEAEVKESKKESAETKVASENTESNEPESSVSSVSLVSTEGSGEETTVAENVTVETAMEASAEEESIAEESTEAEAGEAETTVSETVAETALETKDTEVKKDKAIFEGFLQEVIEHYEEFLGELETARFAQYSLNELGRKTQNVEIKGFVTVEVFYEEAAFDRAVVLEAKRLFKPEEEAEGEKLSEEQIKVLKEHSLYDDAASLDIRFVDKKDSTVEVEPKSPVSVRISIDKKALPAEVSSDAISIHHLVENDETKAIEKVEVVVQPSGLKSEEVLDSEETSGTLKTEEDKNDTITKEFVVDSFSLYQITWTDSALQNCPPVIFHYVDKNFNEIGPTVRREYNYPTGLEKYIKNRWKDPKYWQMEVPADAKGNINIFDKVAKTGEAYKTFNGYDFVAAYPYAPKSDNLDKIVNNNRNDYFDLNYKYNNGEGDFRSGISKIDNLGYIIDGRRYVWYTIRRGTSHYEKGCPNEIYFVYDTETNETKKRTEEDIETKQDKYIKDNQDGTYDLTLSAQVKKKTKPENLDIVFLVDTSKTMKMSFGTGNNIIGDIPSDKLAPAGKSRKELVQEYLSQMVTSLSKNSSYNLRFGLVGFGGSKTDDGTTISDTAFNDVTYLGGFTESASGFNTMLRNLPESEGSQTGPNYTAAIMGARRLLDGSFGPTSDGRPSNFAGGIDSNISGIARADANKIIVLIADNDPVYSYALEDGVYDETRKTSGGLSNFTASLQKGYSYGNGVDFSRVALNQARGFLTKFNSNSYTAFYTIGIGNKDNWKHLKELTQEHGPSEFTGDDNRPWEDVPHKNSRKFIRAKSTLLKGADSKIFDGSTPESLKSSIIELGQKIAPSATELTITDTLSQNVTLVKDAELKAEVFKMKANGVDTDGEALTKDQLKELGLNGFNFEKPNPALQQGGDIKLTTDPADFSLPAGYEIRLTATIKPSAKAYEKLRNGQASKDEGDERTDLQDIYRKEGINLPSEFNNPAMYGTSAGKNGLYTNDKAKFGYKWKGQDKGNDYKRPIIKVKRADLKIEKTFVGLDKNLVNNSSGVTKFGKKIVQQLKFDILRSEKKSGRTNTAISFLTINFGEAPWADALNAPEVSQNGKKVKVTIDGENHEVTIRLVNEANNMPKLSITIDHLDSEKYNYHVWEYINGFENGKAEAVSDPNDPQGPKYRYIDGGSPQGPKTIDNTACGIFTFENSYQKEEQKKTITIKKIVEEFGGTAYTNEAKKDNFEFDIAFYKRDGLNDVPLNANELEPILHSLETKYPKKTFEISVDSHKLGSLTRVSIIHFQLHHDESIEIAFNPNYSFRIFEEKKDGYESAKVDTMKGNTKGDIGYQEEKLGRSIYTYTDLTTNQGQTVVFKNPRITVVPTGLRGDLTPYLFSIFGFTLMAGAYFAINKKKRREI